MFVNFAKHDKMGIFHILNVSLFFCLLKILKAQQIILSHFPNNSYVTLSKFTKYYSRLTQAITLISILFLSDNASGVARFQTIPQQRVN